METCLFFDPKSMHTNYRVVGRYVSVPVSSISSQSFLQAKGGTGSQKFLSHIIVYDNICNCKRQAGFCSIRVFLFVCFTLDGKSVI